MRRLIAFIVALLILESFVLVQSHNHDMLQTVGNCGTDDECENGTIDEDIKDI